MQHQQWPIDVNLPQNAILKPPPPPASVPDDGLYDWVFVGSGAAATLLLLALERRGALAGRQVAIVDPDAKARNDKTFCFWARPSDAVAEHCAPLVSHRWSAVRMNQQPREQLEPWVYHHIPSTAVYAELHRMVAAHGIHSVRAAVQSLEATEAGVEVRWPGGGLRARQVFDSRPPQFQAAVDNQAHLLQSFIGWVIETDHPVPDPECVELMDFSVDQTHSTQFVYVLPLGPRSLLVELTRFGETGLAQEAAYPLLHAYIQERFGTYRQVGEEAGCIPMSSAPLAVETVPGVICIGGRGGAIKPSTGYAFKTMFAQAQWLADAARAPAGTPPAPPPTSPGRFRLYDRLLLDILRRSPAWGKPIFSTLFRRNPTANVLRFLDEKTTFSQDLRILLSLPLAPFLAAWMRDAWVRLRPHQPPLGLATVACGLWMAHAKWPAGYPMMEAGGLMLGLLAVGIPHGALDHLLAHRRLEAPWNLAFIARYLAASLALLAVWLVAPGPALAFFLLYSAWHFGQGDVEHWGIRGRRQAKSATWGLTVLSILLLGHPQESAAIIEKLGVALPALSPAMGQGVAWAWAGCAALWGLWERRLAVVLAAATLAVTVQLPLLAAFGLYFIGQHSLHGWWSLRRGLSASDAQLYRRALPFSAAAFGFLGLAVAGLHWGWLAAFQQDVEAAFFVFLSCISFPHVVAMHRFHRTAGPRS